MISTSHNSSSLGFGWSSVGRRLRWLTHPITIFVSLQIVWLAITLIWVIWFVGERVEIARLAQRFGTKNFQSGATVAILVVGCVLLGVLLVGTILLFVFGQRQSSAARQQRSFVSSVTHELKSPLASLQLAFETMSAHKLDEATETRLMGMIQTDIDRLRRLVDQILVAGRLDRSVLMFDEDGHDVAVSEMIRRIVDRLSYLDQNLAARLTVDCPENLVVKLPRPALTLILTNLIENAAKYSPHGAQVDVVITHDGTEMRASVRDRGIGLDKKDKRRIFRMFHRSESAVKKAIPGTGLGLFIVKSAVRSLDGRVWVESPGPGQGATFFVALPARTSGLAGSKQPLSTERDIHG